MIIARVLPALLAGGLLIFVALMIGAVFWAKSTPVPVEVQTDTSARIVVPTKMGLLEAEVVLLPDLAYELDIHVDRTSGVSGPIRPTVVLDMLDMAMPPLEPPLHVVSANEFHQAGRFSMPGRWRFQLGFADDLHDLEVVVGR